MNVFNSVTRKGHRLAACGIAFIAAAAAGVAGAQTETTIPMLPPAPEPPAASGLQRPDLAQVKDVVIDAWKYGNNPPNSGQLIDATIATMSVAYPPAGVALGVGKSLLSAMGAFGSTDPVGDALKQMSARIDDLNNRVNGLHGDIVALWKEAYRNRDDDQWRELLRRQEELSKYLIKMRDGPFDAASKLDRADELTVLVKRYLPMNTQDANMWLWSDAHVYTQKNEKGQVLLDAQGNQDLGVDPQPPAFRPLPMLELYTNTLIAWMTAIQMASNGDATFVKAHFGRDLLQQAGFLSVRPADWNEAAGANQPSTLPEAVMERVSCHVAASSKYATNGQCLLVSRCEDTMTGRTTSGQSGYFKVAPGTSYCTFPAPRSPSPMSEPERQYLRSHPVFGSEAMARWEQYQSAQLYSDERDFEESYGVQAIAALADTIVRLATLGTVRPPFQGHFASIYYEHSYLYGVKADGQLIWYQHLIEKDYDPQTGLSPATRARIPTGGVSLATLANVTRNAASLLPSAPAHARTRGLLPQRLSVANGSMRVDAGARTASSAAAASNAALSPALRAALTVAPDIKDSLPRVSHELEGPNTVGTGWQIFKEVLPGGLGSLYGLTPQGVLKWYRHDGFTDGSVKWKGPITVGSGWNGFRRIVAAGDGILYGIGADGSLRWYRHGDVADAATQPQWSGPKVVGSGWQQFTRVFSTGEGVLYGITADGKLMWYRHTGYLDGSTAWAGPKQVGNGWQSFKSVVSSGNGFIYAVKPTGELLWYHHIGYQDGGLGWEGPVRVGADFGRFNEVFPVMWGMPQAPEQPR